MKMFFYGLLILLACLSLEVNAQFKSSEQQYLSEENLAINGGFEQGKKNWTNANGTFSVDTAFKVLGNSSGKVELTAQTLDFSQTLTTGYNTSLSGLQGQVSAYVKANFAFEVCALIDGAESNCLQGNSDNSFDFYQIPIVLGGTSLGIKFKSIGAVTGTIYVDGVSYGHKQFVQDIAQAEYVGRLILSNCSLWSVSSTTFSTPTATGCNYTSVGGVSPPLTNTFGFRLIDAKVGVYKITSNGASLRQDGSSMGASARWSDGTLFVASGELFGASSSQTNVPFPLEATFNYSNSVNNPISINMQIRATASGTARIEPNAYGQPIYIDVYYYPPKSKIVTQLQEETVQTANEFSAKISNNGTIISENLDWISGTTCPIVGVNRRCTLNDLGITSPMACVVSAENVDTTQANQIEAEFEAITTTYIDYNMTISGVGNNNIQASIKCQKQGADYNKSRMVYGQFEQIKSGAVPKVTASGNGGGAYTLNTPLEFTTETKDTNNAWNGTTFAVPESGEYIITGSTFFTALLQHEIRVYINGVGDKAIGRNDGADYVLVFGGVIYLTEGQSVTFRSNTSGTYNNNSIYHHIHIQKLSDIESLVKNLNPSNVKCQTKFLSANIVGVSTDIANLRFQNITVGKKYKVIGQSYLQNQTLKAIHNSSELCTIYSQTTQSTISMNSGVFTAETSTVTFNSTAGGTLFGNGTKNFTWVQLCELPDNYIETTEW